MPTTVQHPRLSASEFAMLQDESGWSKWAELIDGEVVVMPPVGMDASSARGQLYEALRRWQERTGDGGLLLQDVFVRLPVSHNTPAPDISWWSTSRRPEIRPGAANVVPDWVAEVLSPATRANDLGPKREQYLASGVRELWLVDPAARTVLVVAADGTERLAADMSASTVLGGFAVETASLFAA